MSKLKICIAKFSETARRGYMFEMPTDEFIEEGDHVIVPSADDEPSEAIVVATGTYNFDYSSDVKEMDRLLAVSGATMPFKKVIGTVERKYFKYEEEVSADGEES